MPQPSWTAFIQSINSTKQDLIRGADDPDAAERVYSPFLMNRTLAQFPDTVFLANQMNLYPHLPRLMQHDFLLHAVPVGTRTPKRRSRSRINEDDVELVEHHFNYSRLKALRALKLLSKQHLSQLGEHYGGGG
jgi:NACalpha-BTF3-like transcription factor